jgi:hypothetical protein
VKQGQGNNIPIVECAWTVLIASERCGRRSMSALRVRSANLYVSGQSRPSALLTDSQLLLSISLARQEMARASAVTQGFDAMTGAAYLF